MWQGGRATFAGGSWLSNESLRVSYASYLAGESGSRRHRGDPLYITLIPVSYTHLRAHETLSDL
eukprot:11516233-Karenia_brevis.AAC.1